MMLTWLGGLLRRRGGRLLAVSTGVALAVALIGALGAFLTASQSTMTARALRSVAVDWQVQVQPGADPQQVLRQVTATPGVTAALPVHFAASTGFSASGGGTSQTTGPGVVLGLPDTYRATFPGQVRTLSGADTGVLIAQQTAANLRVRPGDRVRIGRPGRSAVTVTVAGVVDLPQADTLFQKVGAPAGSQPTAPPDNVLLLPARTFGNLSGPTSARPTDTTQIHVGHQPPPQASPAAAYTSMLASAHNLEAQLAGGGIVGNNVAAALGGARGDAAYAQMLFLFLGLPGAVLAALLTASLVGAGAGRRRAEQALLRIRGLDPRRIARLATAEALLVGVIGGLLGLVAALAAGRLAFGPASFGTSRAATAAWFGVAFTAGLLITGLTVLVPAVRDLRGLTVADARRTIGRPASPWWMRYGVDLILIAGALVVFAASSRNNYTLVLAPEGVPTIAVSYWAFLGPALLWLGAALLLWRLAIVALTRDRRPLARLIAPLTGRLARPGAAALTRQRRPLARAIVLLALAVSFAASTAVFNATYAQQAEADAQLTNGADVTITPAPGTPAAPALAAAVAATPGVRRVEPVQHRFAYVGADLQDLYGVRPDTITSATALQDAYFQGGTAAQLMATLAARPDSVLVSAETVKDFQLNPGDLLNLRLQDATTKKLRTVPFHYAGIVNEFPTAPKDSFFVANADYVARTTGSDAAGAFLVDTGGRNQPAVAAALRQQVGTAATITDITQTRAQVGSSLTSVNLAGLTRLELTFAVLLATAAGGLVLLAGMAERRRTQAIITVLGARRRQLRGLVLSEAALVTAGGLAGGTVIAWGLSQMLVKVLTGVFDPPPSSIAVPAGYLSITVLAVLAAITAAAVASARTSTRPPVEELRDL
jgi:putative ABC transport system permease protein